MFLLGAELNAEIEHASPYGKDVGEKVPGAKRAIGALGYRRYLERPAPVFRPQPLPSPAAATVTPPRRLQRVLMAMVAAVIVFRRREG